MKLRNKLAAVLATAMVVTSVPVVTMAYSSNSINRENLLQAKDAEFKDATTAPAVRIEFKSRKLSEINSTDKKEVFYVTLENAEWLEGAVSKKVPAPAQGSQDMSSLYGSNMTITRDSDKTIKVEITGDISASTYTSDDKVLYIPILATLKEGEAKVKIETKGSGSTVTGETLVFGNTTEEVATATVGSAKSFHKDGKIAEIKITEAYKGSTNTGSSSKNNFALIELNDTDFEFDLKNDTANDTATYYIKNNKEDGNVRAFTSVAANKYSDVKYTHYTIPAEFAYGFANTSLSTVDVYVSEDDASAMYVKIPNLSADSQGQIKLKELYVKSTVKNPEAGELTVDISGDVEEAKKLVVANIGNYGVKVSVKDDKVVEIVAGQKEEVEFTIKETIDNTFTEGREIEVKLENGYFAEALLDKNNDVDDNATLKAVQAGQLVLVKELEQKKDSDKVGKYTSTQIKEAITDIEVVDDKVVGFTFKPAALQTGTYTKDKLDSFVITADVRVGLNQSGDVKVTVEGRDIEEAVSAVIVNAKKAVEVTSEAAVVKTGLKDQVAGKITVAEADKAILKRGEKLTFFFEDTTGIELATNKDLKPVVKVTSGDLQLGDVTVTTGINEKGEKVPAVTVEIKRASKEASTIEISDFHFNVDRRAAQGSYKVTVGGKALTDFTTTYDRLTDDKYEAPAEVITVADFVVNGTPNTEDMTAANGLRKGTSTFVIGESKYTVNGVEKVMDAKSYIKDPGFTMVPVRFVAEAFGVSEDNILFSNGTVTLFAGNRTVQLTNGSDIAVVNGASIKMAAPVEIKENRTYAPIGEIAQIFGLSKEWTPESKVASFTNN